MDVGFGNGQTAEGPGVEIRLTGNELATAIDAYLVAHGVQVNGPRTIRINGQICGNVKIYVDPSGNVIWGGQRYTGDGKVE